MKPPAPSEGQESQEKEKESDTVPKKNNEKTPEKEKEKEKETKENEKEKETKTDDSASDSDIFLIHSTGWNVLHVSDPRTGELLTNRLLGDAMPDESPYEGKRDSGIEHFLCELSVSTDYKYVVSDGWVWHPVGVAMIFNVENWLAGDLYIEASATSLDWTENW